MSAQIINLPRRGRAPSAIRVERVDGGDWHTVYRGYAWPHGSREAALQEADRVAAVHNATIIVQAPEPGSPPC